MISLLIEEVLVFLLIVLRNIIHLLQDLNNHIQFPLQFQKNQKKLKQVKLQLMGRKKKVLSHYLQSKDISIYLELILFLIVSFNHLFLNSMIDLHFL